VVAVELSKNVMDGLETSALPPMSAYQHYAKKR